MGLQDLPFAAAVGSCYKHVAAELLQKLEALQRHRSSLFHKITTQLHCIYALEQRLTLSLPHPQQVCQQTAVVTHKSAHDAVSEHCSCILNALASASLHSTPVPYWHAVSEGVAPALPSVTHAVAQWRSNTRRSSMMIKKPAEHLQRLPAIGKFHWTITTPMQKLEQLGTQLVLARATKHQTLVVLGTTSVAVYLRQLLESLQGHGYKPIGTVVVISPDMTFHEVLLSYG